MSSIDSTFNMLDFFLASVFSLVVVLTVVVIFFMSVIFLRRMTNSFTSRMRDFILSCAKRFTSTVRLVLRRSEGVLVLGTFAVIKVFLNILINIPLFTVGTTLGVVMLNQPMNGLARRVVIKMLYIDKL
uniref:Uncharacterized protein n=1 Tax=Cacopsylla melanoneura TaxID=428564 RepID=A0A8D8XGE2_9HEMI